MDFHNISDSEFVMGLRENLIAYLRTLSAMPEVVIEEAVGVIRAATGVPAAFMNPVITIDVIDDAEKSVIETNSFYDERKLPYAWYDLRNTHSANLNDHLIKIGAVFTSDMPGMCVALSDIDEELALPDGLEIIVTGDNEMHMWNDITADVYDVPESVQADYSRFMIRVNQIPEMKCYVGLLNDVPAATVMMLYSPNAAGIYSVATMPYARNRGIGAAITRKAMLDAKSDGYPMAVLEASQMGMPVYRRLGFVEYCKIGLYVKLRP